MTRLDWRLVPSGFERPRRYSRNDTPQHKHSLPWGLPGFQALNKGSGQARERRGGSFPSLTRVRPWEKNNKVEFREPGVFNKSAPTWRSAGAWGLALGPIPRETRTRPGKRAVVLITTRPRRTESNVSWRTRTANTESPVPPARRTKTTALSAKQTRAARIGQADAAQDPGLAPNILSPEPPSPGPGRAGREGGAGAPGPAAAAGVSSSRSPPSFLLAQSLRSRQPKALNLNGSRSANSADSRAPGLGGGERASQPASQRGREGEREARRGQGRGGRRCDARGARGGDGDGGGPLGACTMELALSPPPPASRPRRAGSRFHVTCTKRNGFWGRP